MAIEKEEVTALIVGLIVLTFAVRFLEPTQFLITGVIIAALVIGVNLITKKLTAYALDTQVSARFWHVERYGFAPHQHFRKPLPFGIILSILVSLLSLGKIFWLAILTFEIKPQVYRAAKRHGLYSFTEVTEFHIGIIAAVGILANLFAAAIAYFLNFPEFSRLSIYYACFNLLPFSELDGNKIFFGSIILWSFTAILTLIALGYAIALV